MAQVRVLALEVFTCAQDWFGVAAPLQSAYFCFFCRALALASANRFPISFLCVLVSFLALAFPPAAPSFLK